MFFEITITPFQSVGAWHFRKRFWKRYSLPFIALILQCLQVRRQPLLPMLIDR